MNQNKNTNNIEVLVLNGSPGSGKSTVSNAIADKLRGMDIVHAVIDVDELARVYPESHDSIKWKNLGSIWPNYTIISNLKIIIPVVIDDKEALQALRDVTPCKKFIICELMASDSILKNRVTEREPNKYWQSKLRGLVDSYLKHAVNKFADFKVRTDDKSIDDTVKVIMEHLGWHKT